ncbi:MAG: phytochelatin synthase family protein [Thiohalocapsa sp.]|nr:phytochelatin synthase family protein [Thiohalocapsa sp.]MCF7990928.1 phytochelatin synthase family protein [Thiohalocapsa sp.]
MVTLAVVGAYFGYRISHPSPEDFHAEVVTAGVALDQALREAPAAVYLSDFRFQETWSTCGPASLRNVLVSLGHGVGGERALFDDDRLAWWKALGTGMTLDELAALARANAPFEVEVLRPESLEAFRQILAEADRPRTRLIVNFDREPLFGVGVGHFSPIGGFDPETGLVTLLDVTEGYGFSLVPDRLLFEASRSEDPMSGRPRGLLRIVDPTRASARSYPPTCVTGLAREMQEPSGHSVRLPRSARLSERTSGRDDMGCRGARRQPAAGSLLAQATSNRIGLHRRPARKMAHSDCVSPSQRQGRQSYAEAERTRLERPGQ